MAKKKAKAIETDVIESPIEEEVIETSVTEFVTEEEVVEEVTSEPIVEEKSDVNKQFLYTQLDMINKLNNPAKAKRLTDRVLRNRKR